MYKRTMLEIRCSQINMFLRWRITICQNDNGFSWDAMLGKSFINVPKLFRTLSWQFSDSQPNVVNRQKPVPGGKPTETWLTLMDSTEPSSLADAARSPKRKQCRYGLLDILTESLWLHGFSPSLQEHHFTLLSGTVRTVTKHPRTRRRRRWWWSTPLAAAPEKCQKEVEIEIKPLIPPCEA